MEDESCKDGYRELVVWGIERSQESRECRKDGSSDVVSSQSWKADLLSVRQVVIFIEILDLLSACVDNDAGGEFAFWHSIACSAKVKYLVNHVSKKV
jgi:hypothetical protein